MLRRDRDPALRERIARAHPNGKGASETAGASPAATPRRRRKISDGTNAGKPHGLLDGRRRLRFETNLAEGGFVLADVLVQHVRQRLGLLRAQKDTLIVLNGNTLRRALRYRAKKQEKIPQADAHLNAVGVGFPIIGSVGQLNFRGCLLWVHALLSILR